MDVLKDGLSLAHEHNMMYPGEAFRYAQHYGNKGVSSYNT